MESLRLTIKAVQDAKKTSKVAAHIYILYSLSPNGFCKFFGGPETVGAMAILISAYEITNVQYTAYGPTERTDAAVQEAGTRYCYQPGLLK